MAKTKVWYLTARCPECHAPVRIRNTDVALRMLDLALREPDIDPESVIQTYQCAREMPNGKLCNAFVEIRLRHWKTYG